jgi:hypothetical protein
MRILTIALALAVLGTSIPDSDAQRMRPEVAQGSDKAGDKAERKKAKLKKRLRTMRAVFLIDELELDEETAAKLMPILNKYDDEFAKLAKEALDLRARLDSAADADLDDLIDDLVANQRARWTLDEKRFKEVRKVLTRKQAARILIVLPEIDRRLLEGARKAIKGPKARKKARLRKGGGDPADELENPY